MPDENPYSFSNVQCGRSYQLTTTFLKTLIFFLSRHIGTNNPYIKELKVENVWRGGRIDDRHGEDPQSTVNTSCEKVIAFC